MIWEFKKIYNLIKTNFDMFPNVTEEQLEIWCNKKDILALEKTIIASKLPKTLYVHLYKLLGKAMTEDYSAYIGHNNPPNEAIEEIVKLAEAQNAAEIKVEEIEEELKIAKDKLKEISERQLPEKMDALGLPMFKTPNGVTVSIREKVQASPSVANRPRAYSWLEDNGYGGMIKSHVTVPFKKDEIKKANEFVKNLQEEGLLANLERKVEPMTLLAFVKEHLSQGKDIPIDVFGIFRRRVAEIKIDNK